MKKIFLGLLVIPGIAFGMDQAGSHNLQGLAGRYVNARNALDKHGDVAWGRCACCASTLYCCPNPLGLVVGMNQVLRAAAVLTGPEYAATRQELESAQAGLIYALALENSQAALREQDQNGKLVAVRLLEIASHPRTDITLKRAITTAVQYDSAAMK